MQGDEANCEQEKEKETLVFAVLLEEDNKKILLRIVALEYEQYIYREKSIRCQNSFDQ